MKENDDWTSVVTALKAASEAGMYAFWRERFGTNHPQHPTDEIDNPTQYAYANWIAAKHVYIINKDALDKQCNYLKNDCEPLRGITEQVELFIAMRRVVIEEMNREIETLLTTEETMPVNTKWKDDQYLLDEEEDLEVEQEPLEDEDEEYVRQTETISHDDDDDDDDDDELLNKEDSEDSFADDEY